MMWSSPALILNTSLSLLTSIFYLWTLNQAEVEWSTCCRAPSAEQERNYRVRGGKRRVHGGCGGTVCGVCLCMCVLLISEAFVSTRAVVPHVDLLTKWFLSLSLSLPMVINVFLPQTVRKTACLKDRGGRGGTQLLSRPDRELVISARHTPVPPRPRRKRGLPPQVFVDKDAQKTRGFNGFCTKL